MAGTEDAVLRIVAREGLDAVSFRTVAAEAGLPLARVQREFGTKDELLRRTLLHTVAAAEARIDVRVRAMGAKVTVRAIFDAMADEVLPGSPEILAEARVWLAFVARAATSPALAEPLREYYAEQARAGHEGLAMAHLTGAVGPDLDPTADTLTIVALIDGLVTQVLLGVLDHDRAADLLRRHLDRLMPTDGPRASP
jgi:AcrR family transcriptional regulator